MSLNRHSASRRAGLQLLAIIFIVLGVVGLFLPFLQGILFLLIGACLLSLTSPVFKTWFDRHLVRFPKVKVQFDRYYGRIETWFNKKTG